MSFLEDVFLQDEADEAQELERVIEGDELDDQPRAVSPNSDDDSEKEDEAEEDKRRVDPTKAKEKKVARNPRFLLNPARLTGPRGIQVIPEHFKDFKFKGKGHEKEDLDLVLKRLEHWAYRLYPKFQFEDCLKKIETLGKKRPVMVHLHKIRTDQFQSEETVVQQDSSDDEAPQEEDEFDRLLQQQIELARATPAPGSVRKGFQTPGPDRSSSLPKATSSPSISDEQKERMLRNRRLAEEKRLARLKVNSTTNNSVSDDTQTDKHEHITTEIESIDITEEIVPRKNRSNVIDDECDVTAVNESITVDIHNSSAKKVQTDNTESRIEKDIDGSDDEIVDSVDEITELQIDRDNVTEYNDIGNNQIVHNIDCEVEAIQTKPKEINAVDTNAVVDTNKCLRQSVNNDTEIEMIDVNEKVNSEIVSDDITEVIGNTAIPEGTDVKKTDNFEKSIEENNEINRETVSKEKSKEKDCVNIEDELGGIMDVDFSDDF